MFFVQNAIVFWFASDNTTYTFEMPAANVTVTAEFEKYMYLDETFESYDVVTWWTNIKDQYPAESGSSSTTLDSNIIIAKNYVSDRSGGITAGIVSADENKYLHLVGGSFSTSSRGNRINFSELNLPNVEEIKSNYAMTLEFDAKLAGTDAANIVGVAPAIVSGSNGFVTDKWQNVKVIINKDKSGHMLVENDGVITNTPFIFSGDTLTMITQYNASNTLDVDNLKIYVNEAPEFTNTTVTIQYQDEEGNTIKESTTDTAITDAYYKVADTAKTTFEDTTDGTKYRYTYTSTGSTDYINAVSDEAKTITLKFTKEAYTATPIKVVIPEAKAENVTVTVLINGTANDTTAPGATITNKEINVTIPAGSTEATNSSDLVLLPGVYTYEVTAGAYKAVNATSLSLGSLNTIELEANSAPVTSVVINYIDKSTSSSISGGIVENSTFTTIQSITVEDLYAGNEFDASNYIKDLRVVKSSENADTFTRYTFDSTSTTAINELSATAGENVINLEYTNEGSYYHYQEFDDITEEKTWDDSNRISAESIGMNISPTSDGTNRFTTTVFLAGEYGGYNFVKAVKTAQSYTNNSGRGLIYTLPTALGGEGKNVEFKLKAVFSAGNGNANNTPNLVLADSAGTQIFTTSDANWGGSLAFNGTVISRYNAETAPNGYSYGTSWWKSGNSNLNSTLAMDISAKIDFTTKMVTMTATEISTNRTIYNATYKVENVADVKTLTFNVNGNSGFVFDDIAVKVFDGTIAEPNA